MSRYEVCKDEVVFQISDKLVEEVYPELGSARIIYMFDSKDVIRNGKRIGANIRTVNDLSKSAGIAADFIVTINESYWTALKDEHRVALLDHELAHTVVDHTDKGIKYKLKPHDIEDFVAVVKRHGTWTASLEYLEAAIANNKQGN